MIICMKFIKVIYHGKGSYRILKFLYKRNIIQYSISKLPSLQTLYSASIGFTNPNSQFLNSNFTKCFVPNMTLQKTKRSILPRVSLIQKILTFAQSHFPLYLLLVVSILKLLWENSITYNIYNSKNSNSSLRLRFKLPSFDRIGEESFLEN